MYRGNSIEKDCFERFHFSLLFREEWEWLHKNSMNNNDEILTPTAEYDLEENGIALFKSQFQEAARDLCLMLSKIQSNETFF